MKHLLLLTALLSLISGCGDDTPTPTKAAENTQTTAPDGNDGKPRPPAKMPDGRVWMTENLNVEIGNSWCYHDSASYCKKYGRLYDWETARAVCPTGFHLPSYDEWYGLVSAAGDWDMAGEKLKAKSGWNRYDQITPSGNYENRDGNGNDEYGFSALPGGSRGDVENYGVGYGVGYSGIWWTNTEQEGTNKWEAHNIVMFAQFMAASEYSKPKTCGFSVRCIQNYE